MTSTSSQRLQSAAYLWVVALATFVPLLVTLGYAMLQFETLLVIAGLALASLVLAVVLGRFPIGYDALLALLVYWMADTYVPGSSRGATVGAILGISVFVLLRSRFAENVRSMLLAFGVVWLIGCVMVSGTPYLDPPVPQQVAGKAGVQLRPIVHLVLDEQMSPLTLPGTVPEGHPAATILSDYLARRFDVFSHAQSHSSNTHVSLSELVGLEKTKNYRETNHGEFTHTVIENRYHKQLLDQGYAVTIMQSNYLQICPPDSGMACHTYTRGNNGDAMHYFPDSLIDRLALMFFEVHSAYMKKSGTNSVRLYRTTVRMLERGGLVNRDVDSMFYTRPTLMLNLFDDVAPRLASIKPGEAYFLHFMTPHFPYMLDTDCHLKPYRDWTAPNRYARIGKPEATIYAGYWDQSACVHKRVMALVDTMMAAEVKPILYIHGDHGSRISGKKTKGNTPDLLETFLAVYDEGKSSGREDAAVLELQPQFAKLFAEIDRQVRR